MIYADAACCQVYFFLLSQADAYGRTNCKPADVTHAFDNMSVETACQAFKSLIDAKLLSFSNPHYQLTDIRFMEASQAPETDSQKDAFLASVIAPTQMKDVMCKQLRLTHDQFDIAAAEVIAEWEFVGHDMTINNKECRQHFLNHMRVKAQKERGNTSSTSSFDDREARKQKLIETFPWLTR